MTVGGISHTWPGAAAGMDDNVVSGAAQGAGHLTFLRSSTNGPPTVILTITYTDGTAQTATLGFSDWTLNSGNASISFGNLVACQMSYRNSTSGTSQQITTYVFASSPIALNTSKRGASVTPPATVSQGHLHAFAWSIW